MLWFSRRGWQMSCPFHSVPPYLWSFPLSLWSSLSPCLFLIYSSSAIIFSSFPATLPPSLCLLSSIDHRVQAPIPRKARKCCSYMQQRNTWRWGRCCTMCAVSQQMKSVDPSSLEAGESWTCGVCLLSRLGTFPYSADHQIVYCYFPAEGGGTQECGSAVWSLRFFLAVFSLSLVQTLTPPMLLRHPRHGVQVLISSA